MADIVDVATRSRMMSGIRAKNTKPEVTLRKGLFNRGFRYRLHASSLPGKPDLVLPKWNAAVFVHGCFWHRHAGCKLTSTPATRRDFWSDKFSATTARDLCTLQVLQQAGWRTAIVWECQLRGKAATQTVEAVAAWITSGSKAAEFSKLPQNKLSRKK